MKKLKMAIVSSFSESCGNAAFTRVLHDSIEYFYENIDVEVIELNLKLLQAVNSKIRLSANSHIDDICYRLKLFDYVNIQMEAGLYGTLPTDIIYRFNKIVRSNKATSVTLHSPRLISSNHLTRAGIKHIFKGNYKTGIKEILSSWYGDVHLRINKKIIECIKKNKLRAIVHTERSKENINALYQYNNIIVHPLKLVGPFYNYNSNTFQSIIKQINLKKKDSKFIGMFGYISQYKGHVQALQALELLPIQYKLLFFGRQHPQTLKSDGSVDAYIDHLVFMCNTNDNIKNRVFFLGELNDDDFFNVVSDVDISWLPYFENGQDGSGIASICLDLCPRVICSSSFAFDELFKLINYKNVMRFDIGNTSELALKTEMMMRKDLPQKPYGKDNIFNLRTQANIYVEDFINSSEVNN